MSPLFIALTQHESQQEIVCNVAHIAAIAARNSGGTSIVVSQIDEPLHVSESYEQIIKKLLPFSTVLW